MTLANLKEMKMSTTTSLIWNITFTTTGRFFGKGPH